jgi:hypothetical protein
MKFYIYKMRIGCTILIFLYCYSISRAQSNFFSKTYDIESQSAFGKTHGMVLTYDSCFVFAYNKNNQNTETYFINLVKVDASGNSLWRKTFQCLSGAFLTKVAQTPDSGFVLTTSTDYQLDTINAIKIIVIKTDKFGEEEWVKMIGSDEMSQLNRDLIPTESGIIMLTSGSIEIANNQYENGYFIARIDFSGNLIWFNKYNWSGGPYPKKMLVSENKIYVFSEINNGGYLQFALSKIGMNGNIIWSKMYYPQRDINPLNAIINTTGELVITGRTWGSNDNQWDIFLMSVDSNGTFNWMKKYGGDENDEGYFVFQTQYGYVIGAEPESFGNTSRAALIATDEFGDLQWMRLYGDSLGSFPNGMVQTNNGFVIYGIKGSYGDTAPIYLLNVDASGNACQSYEVTLPDSSLILTSIDTGSVGVVNGIIDYDLLEIDMPISDFDNCAHDDIEQLHTIDIQFLPNPANDLVHYTCSEPTTSVNVYDICGKQLSVPPSQNNSIDISNLSSGIYIAEIGTKSFHHRQRFVKL